MPFLEALMLGRVKSLLPTSLSSAELREFAPELLERARFSARTTLAGYVQEIDDLVAAILTPRTEDGRTVGKDFATARLEAKQKLRALGYEPSAEDRGTIKDLGSDQRVNLVLKTNVDMMQGHGAFQRGMDEDALDAFPAQELFRAEGRKEPRDWRQIWTEAGGQLFDGRMIALKTDEIWVRISDFGLPYPPFRFGSGMWVRNVARDIAEGFGLLKAGDRLKPQSRGFNEDLAMSADLREARLKEALLAEMPGAYFDAEGVLHA